MRAWSRIIRRDSPLAQNEFGDIKEIARKGCNCCARNWVRTGLTSARPDQLASRT